MLSLPSRVWKRLGNIIGRITSACVVFVILLYTIGQAMLLMPFAIWQWVFERIEALVERLKP